MRGASAWALALAVLLPSASAGWDTYHGDAQRTGATVAPATLDVLLNSTMSGRATPFWGATLLDTPEGMLSLRLRTSTSCTLVTKSSADAEEHEVWNASPCGYSLLAGYDEPTHAAYVCTSKDGKGPLLRAIDVRDGHEIWALDAASTRGAAATGTSTGQSCASTAMDPAHRHLIVPIATISGLPCTGTTAGDVFVPCSARSMGEVVAIGADRGDVVWDTVLPPQTDTASPLPREVEDRSFTGLAPFSVTLTSAGAVVTGYAGCDNVDAALGTECEGFVAWLDLQGNVHGVERAATGKPPGTGNAAHAASQYAITQGSVAMVALGSEVLLLNPERSGVTARAPLHSFEPPTQNVFWEAGVWMRDLAVLALPQSLTAVEPATLNARWAWSEGGAWEVGDVLRDGDASLLVLLGDESTNHTKLARVDATSGRKTAELPLPLGARTPGVGGFYAQMVPLQDGSLAIVTPEGPFAHVGTRLDPPPVGVSDEYPAVAGKVVLLPVQNDSVVDWGDGVREDVKAGASPSHAYREPGDVQLRVTSLLGGGLTSTSTRTMHVGATPPPDLTSIQRAFAPENQNLTFGILGIALTILGAIFTVGRTRRRIARLEREMAAMEELRVLSARDPREAVRALRDYRDRLPDEVARGHLDESQYHVLDLRSARQLRILRARLTAPFALSDGLRRRLDAACEDGTLDPTERELLVAELRDEKLAPEARGELVSVLDDFTSRRAA